MDNKKDYRLNPAGKIGFLQGLTVQIKLIMRLMGDKRVSPLLKLLPIGTLVYLVVPDLMPGPIDDALVIWLGSYLFIELCPPEVVAEHKMALQGDLPDAANTKPIQDEDVVDAEYWEEKKP